MTLNFARCKAVLQALNLTLGFFQFPPAAQRGRHDSKQRKRNTNNKRHQHDHNKWHTRHNMVTIEADLNRIRVLQGKQ